MNEWGHWRHGGGATHQVEREPLLLTSGPCIGPQSLVPSPPRTSLSPLSARLWSCPHPVTSCLRPTSFSMTWPLRGVGRPREQERNQSQGCGVVERDWGARWLTCPAGTSAPAHLPQVARRQGRVGALALKGMAGSLRPWPPLLQLELLPVARTSSSPSAAHTLTSAGSPSGRLVVVGAWMQRLSLLRPRALGAGQVATKGPI